MRRWGRTECGDVVAEVGVHVGIVDPLSSPVSATVTMMPLPSRPDHDVSMLAMFVPLQVSSTFMTWMPLS